MNYKESKRESWEVEVFQKQELGLWDNLCNLSITERQINCDGVAKQPRTPQTTDKMTLERHFSIKTHTVAFYAHLYLLKI